jgi:hypothetical protein
MNFVGVSLVKETMVRWQTMPGKMELFLDGSLRERAKREENVQWTFSAQEPGGAVANHAGENGAIYERMSA